MNIFAMYDATYAASLVSVPGSSEHQCGLRCGSNESKV